MKISYDWLKNYIQPKVSLDELSKVLTDMGLEVEEIISFESIKGGLQGLVIGEVKECVQHPNADRLKITKTDIGNGECLQIVCGAPNVAVGQKVVVAPVGCTVHPLSGDAFPINKSKIRGEISEGMICAEDEIGLGTSHEGILILPQEVTVGTLASDFFKVSNDKVLEIGLTPNRPDAASHFGIARDLSAYFKTPLSLQERPIPLPKAIQNTTISIENKDACPRYVGININGISVKESPAWLQNKLKTIGVRPINNVVDITNYILHDLGQPLHAFDAEKISGNQIIIKTCPEGTPFTTLDGVERNLSDQDLMICDQKEPLCIAGVFGGISSSVNLNTKNIFLESAYFNPVWVRKTAKRHGLKTDASFRFERGTDPNMPLKALQKAVSLLLELAGGEISIITDLYPNPIPNFDVVLNYAHVTRLIGKEIDKQEIKNILLHLGILITQETEKILHLSIPPYKVDVTRECDIIEEILRIHGLDKVEIPSHFRASANYSSKPNAETIQNTVADLLSNNGFSEILTNSLSKLEYAINEKTVVPLLNPLSSDLDSMRQSLLYTGLEVVAYNNKHKQNNLRLYEFGKTYFRNDSTYNEDKILALFITGNKNEEYWNQKTSPSNFFTLKGLVELILKRLGIRPSLDIPNHSIWTEGVRYHINQKNIAQLGIVSPILKQKIGIDNTVYYAELYWDNILKILKNHNIHYESISKYPAVRRDLSMLVSNNTSFEQLKLIAEKTERNLLKEVGIFDVYMGEKLPNGEKSYTLSFIFQDKEATLTDEKIDAMMQKITQNLEKEAGVTLRK